MPEPPEPSDDPASRPAILVTGSHRSGTTWVGRMLAAADGVAYVHEPFHPGGRPGVLDAGIERWFAYAPDLDEERLRRTYARMLELDYGFAAEARALSGLRDLARMVRDGGRFLLRRARADRVLVKDPIAALSSAWLADRFDIRVVVLVRHPAAFAHSLARRGWAFPFGDLLAQPRLMEDHLAPFRADLERFRREARPVAEQAALLWSVLYHVLARHVDRHPGWIVARHEDLAADPVGGFASLYERLGLDFTDRCRRTVVEHSRPQNPVRAGERPQAIQRDSRAVAARWREAMDPGEIASVRRRTGELAARWYGEESWG